MGFDSEEQVDQPGREYYSSDEAVAAFKQLSKEERIKLARVAKFFAAGSAGFITPQELINESFIRVADGRRKWAVGKPIVQFLAGVIRSLPSDNDFLPEERKLVRRIEGASVITSDDLENVSVDVEGANIACTEAGEKALLKLEARFAGDEEMEMLLMGICDGLNGKALQETVGVHAKRLEALRTRLNRELAKLAKEYREKEGRS